MEPQQALEEWFGEKLEKLPDFEIEVIDDGHLGLMPDPPDKPFPGATIFRVFAKAPGRRKEQLLEIANALHQEMERDPMLGARLNRPSTATDVGIEEEGVITFHVSVSD